MVDLTKTPDDLPIPQDDGSEPTAAEKQPFIALLENGMTAGALAHLAADTSFNTTNINLVGLAQTGIEYIPVD